MPSYRASQKPQQPPAGPAGDSLDAWIAWLAPLPAPVILLEGTRDLPDAHRPLLAAVAARLARELPRALFRSGNAPGSDDAFASGVAAVGPRRLQVVLPYAGHRQRMIPGGAYPVALSALGIREARRVAEAAAQVAPDRAALFARRDAHPALAAKSAYLLRDTLKVLGSESLGLEPAAAALLYVNPANPLSGGTGHTLRVCRLHSVPVLSQSAWLGWSDAPVIPQPTPPAEEHPRLPAAAARDASDSGAGPSLFDKSVRLASRVKPPSTTEVK